MVQCFLEDVPASVTAKLCLVNRKTANTWYRELRVRLLPHVHTLPPIGSRARFEAYHSRRIAKFNGLKAESGKYYLLESRLRYQLKERFRSLVIDAADDLLQ